MILTAFVVTLAGAAQAEEAETSAASFRLKTVNQVAALPDKVYAAPGEIGRRRSSAHSPSGHAANMAMPLQAGHGLKRYVESGKL